jgi:hypothetical protein
MGLYVVSALELPIGLPSEISAKEFSTEGSLLLREQITYSK